MPFKTPEEKNAYQRKWNATHKEKRREYSKKQQLQRQERYKTDPDYRAQVIAENTKWMSKKLNSFRLIREQLLLNKKCEKCGFTDTRALIIHHHFGNAHHRGKNHRNQYQTLKEIAENKIPFVVLCMNCHTILHGLKKQLKEIKT
jgi:uncharacterized Rmd1/YagE family protein